MQNHALYGSDAKAFALYLIQAAIKISNYKANAVLMENIEQVLVVLKNKEIV